MITEHKKRKTTIKKSKEFKPVSFFKRKDGSGQLVARLSLKNEQLIKKFDQFCNEDKKNSGLNKKEVFAFGLISLFNYLERYKEDELLRYMKQQKELLKSYPRSKYEEIQCMISLNGENNLKCYNYIYSIAFTFNMTKSDVTKIIILHLLKLDTLNYKNGSGKA